MKKFIVILVAFILAYSMTITASATTAIEEDPITKYIQKEGTAQNAAWVRYSFNYYERQECIHAKQAIGYYSHVDIEDRWVTSYISIAYSTTAGSSAEILGESNNKYGAKYLSHTDRIFNLSHELDAGYVFTAAVANFCTNYTIEQIVNQNTIKYGRNTSFTQVQDDMEIIFN